MRKEEFTDAMKDYASKYGEAEVDTINKGSRIYLGLYVRKDNAPSPVVNLDALYEVYRENGVDACWRVVDRILSTVPDFDMAETVKLVEDYSWVKEHLIIRLLSKEVATAGVYEEVEGHYMCPYINLGNGAFVRVTTELMKIWDIEKKELFMDAMISDLRSMLEEADASKAEETV